VNDRWRRIADLFEGAVQLPPSERSRYVSAAAGADEPLRAEVESLLASLEGSEAKLREVVRKAADSLTDDEAPTVAVEVPPVPATRIPPGTLLADRFVIERLAGAGGMGSVYRAHDPQGGGPVAIKLLHEGERTDLIERFSREAQILSELKHPGIVDYVAHGRTPDGQYYLAMEWLEGQDLAALLRAGTRLSIDDSVSILAQAADAIASAHRRGVVHRDLKPSNLFLVDGRPDRIKVLDFGIARTVTSSALTRTGLVLGTPNYMAPEQARSARQLTPAADVFALGCVLYECLTGHPPFDGDQLAAVLTRILFDDPEPLLQQLPGLDPRLAALVEWMMVKDVAARPQDADAVRSALARLNGAEADTIATTAAPRSGTFIDVARGLHGVVLAGAAAGAPKDLGAMLKATKARWEWLLDETFAASVRGYDSALDLADETARIAILVKQLWPAAEVVLSIGVDASQQAAGLHRARRGRGSAGVWLDELAAKLLARRFELTIDHGEPVLRPGAPRVDEDRPLLGRPTACVGREQELGAIEAALVGCADDSEARAVLVLAGPGLGKSRLRHELLRRVATRNPAPLVLQGTGELASAGAPYGVFRQCVRGLCSIEPGTTIDVARERLTAMAGGSAHTACFVGELAGIPFPQDHHPALATARANPQIMQEQIHQAFLALLSVHARRRPVLLVLDDLQWGDALGVALVDYVLREGGSMPILVLALARPELHEVFPRIWHGRRVQELVLPALSRRASERLLIQVLPDSLPPEKIARLIDLSAGNALFLEELARSAAEDPDAPVPKTVIAMIEARVGRLPPDARQTLLLASVLGRVFGRADLRALAYALVGASDNVDSHLEELASAELIARAGANELSFRHALVRDSTYELLAKDERPKIHERAAEVLARGPDPDPIVLAEHWQRSSTPARAIPWLVEAAQTAFARCDLPAAMRLVQRALALGPVGTVRGTLRAVEGLCLGYIGQMPIAALDEALELLPTNDSYWCMACHLRLTLAIMTGQWQDSQPLAERFLAAEPTDEAVAEYITGAGTLSTVFVHAGLPAPAHQFRDRVETVAARRPELPLVQTWRVWTDACLIDVDGAPASDALREAERSVELYRSIANQRNGFFCDGQAAVLIADAGDEAGAVARLRQAIVQAEQLNEHYVRVWLSCLLAQLLAPGPAYDEALAITDVIVSLGVAPPCPDLARGMRARALLTAGRVQEAEESARAALERLAWAPGFAAIPAAALVEALARQGRRDEAIAIGERWLATPPPNTSARAKRAALIRALDQARSQGSS
jgi:tetratricopeptide (TPR) repeat protein